MNAFTIKDLENLSGIKAHTIRIWEQRYGFLKPQRTETNIRYYSNDELKTVLNVALLNKYGFKISHISRMQPEEITDRLLSLTDLKATQERLVNELIKSMVDMDMLRFEKLLNDHIILRGIERTVLQIIFPFLEKIGILWQTGHINPAQEHLVSNLVRQKLIVGIETATPVRKIDRKILLFLPEGEYHELGLLFIYYLLKIRGAETIYLGANVPIADVEHVVRLKKPDLAFLHITGTAQSFNFDRFLQSLPVRLDGLTCIVSGRLTQTYKKATPPSVQFKHNLGEVMDFLATLG